MCDQERLFAEGRFCHIKSKVNGGKGTMSNCIFACTYCNHGYNQTTRKTGMHDENMIPWLKRTYPKTAPKKIKQMQEWGKDVSEDSDNEEVAFAQ